ncbi:MAG: glycoside hydrolase family 127 protein, partial [Bacteroidota bacterium]
MKNTFLFLTALVIILSQSCESQQPETTGDYPITPVDFTRVHLQDGFWKQWVETARDSTIPYAFRKCEETGRIDNF